MKIFRLVFLIFFFFVSPCFGTAYTASVTGNWADPATWGGSGPPGNGDTVTINNGVTVTIPSGTSVTIGTSPSDDTSTAAIACAATTGTGVLTINGTLYYRGTVRYGVASWVIGAGAIIMHDSSQAATPTSAHYTFRSAASSPATAKLTANGTSGSRVTWGCVDGTSGCYAGGIGSRYTTGSEGQCDFNYVDFSYIGGSAANWYQASLGTDGLSVNFNHCTIDHCGVLYIGAMSAGANYTFTYNSITAPSNSSLLVFQWNDSAAESVTGTRLMSYNYIAGKVYFYSPAGDTGLQFHENFIYVDSTSQAGIAVNTTNNPQFSGTNWRDNLTWQKVSSGVAFPTANMPGGAINRTYFLYSSASTGSAINYHFTSFPAVATTLSESIFEPDNGGTGGSDAIQNAASPAGTGTMSYKVLNTLYLPGADGGFGALTTIKDGLAGTCNTSSNICPVVNFEHNTAIAMLAGTGTCGCSGEDASPMAGMYDTVIDNVFWAGSSDTGCIADGLPEVTGLYTTADYNWTWNLTGGSGLYSPAASFSSPGTHDQSGNPKFYGPSRNFLGWGQKLDPTVSSWSDIKSKFSDIATASHDPQWTIKSLIDWVRKGYQPLNGSMKGIATDGGDVGAMTVYKRPPIIVQ